MGLRKNKKKQSSLHLTDKRHPVSGVIATLFGIISVILFVCLCFISSQSHGKAGILIGAGGIFCFLLSAAGFILAWLSLKKENIRPLFPTIAAVVSGLSVVFYMVLYILGKMM